MIDIYNADCRKLFKSVADKTVDLVLTDPPYNLGEFMQDRSVGVHRLKGRSSFVLDGWDNARVYDWQGLMDAFFTESARVLRQGGALVAFMAVIKVGELIETAKRHGFYYKTTGTWHKTNPMPRNMNLHFVNSTEAWVYFIHGAKTGTFNNNGRAMHDFVEHRLRQRASAHVASTLRRSRSLLWSTS